MLHLEPRTQDIALKTFAGIGFLTVLFGGLTLAAFAVSSVPGLGRLSSAAVYLSAVLSPTPSEVLESSPLVSEGTLPTTSRAEEGQTPPSVAPTRGERAEGVFELGTSTGPAITTPLSGLPDLKVSIDAVGYLTSTSTDSFVVSTTSPLHMRPAARFTITNVGTNTARTWRFSASIPTQSAYIFASPFQQDLAPGEHIEYILGFDQAIVGNDRTITITVNPNSEIGESSHANNSASAKITILGS